MFSWLKSKINNRMISEMEGCIHQNIQFANMFFNKFSSDKSRTHQIYWIEEIRDNSIEIKEKRKSNEPFSNEDTDTLMKLNKDCRRIWADELGESNFTFDKKFPK